MNKLKFKLIPFIISLLIVVGSMTGIGIYAYYKYDTNKIRFVNDYFHYEDYQNVSAEEQIDNFVKFESAHYKACDESVFKFVDVNSGAEYNETASQNSKNFIDGATWKDGVLSLPGYFDMKIYAQTSYNEDQETWVYTYYLYLYNVNYKASNLISHLYFSFVDGVTTSENEGEFVGTTKLDQIMKEVKNGQNGTPNGVNCPTYKYEGSISSSYTMYLHDNKATGDSVDKDNVPYVYRLTSMNESIAYESDLEHVTKRRWLSELDSATFSIFYSGKDDIEAGISNGSLKDGVEEIVRGTFTNPEKKVENFNESAEKGAGKDIYKSTYGKFIFWRVFVDLLITFVISGILAFLFYIIWQDTDEQPNNKRKLPTKKKKA